MVWQGDSLRKPSGGRKRRGRHKRKYEYGREASDTKIGARKVVVLRARGRTTKQRLLQVEFVDVIDPKTKKASKAKIKTVTGNPANIHFVRRNIITQGAILDTDAGKVRVTNRPGQDGYVAGVKIE